MNRWRIQVPRHNVFMYILQAISLYFTRPWHLERITEGTLSA